MYDRLCLVSAYVSLAPTVFSHTSNPTSSCHSLTESHLRLKECAESAHGAKLCARELKGPGITLSQWRGGTDGSVLQLPCP